MARSAIHPGEHLAEQLQSLGISSAELGRQLQVPTNRITGILNGRRNITGDTALRLAHFFGTSTEFWLNLQKLYELRLAEQKVGALIRRLPTLAGHAKAPSRKARVRNLVSGERAKKTNHYVSADAVMSKLSGQLAKAQAKSR